MAAVARPWAHKWEELGRIGKGGNATTTRVRSKRDGSMGALKLLHQDGDPARRRRMHREAEALRTLQHPGIPKLLDSNTAEFESADHLFMVIELIEGATLA